MYRALGVGILLAKGLLVAACLETMPCRKGPAETVASQREKANLERSMREVETSLQLEEKVHHPATAAVGGCAGQRVLVIANGLAKRQWVM